MQPLGSSCSWLSAMAGRQAVSRPVGVLCLQATPAGVFPCRCGDLVSHPEGKGKGRHRERKRKAILGSKAARFLRGGSIKYWVHWGTGTSGP